MKYCLGFYFSEDFERVLMLKKNRPDFLSGKFSGLGGKVEGGERSRHAMIRKFMEEAGIETWLSDWTYIGNQSFDNGNEIDVYYGYGDLSQSRSYTDEPVHDVAIADIANYEVDGLAATLINLCIEHAKEKYTS